MAVRTKVVSLYGGPVVVYMYGGDALKSEETGAQFLKIDIDELGPAPTTLSKVQQITIFNLQTKNTLT